MASNEGGTSHFVSKAAADRYYQQYGYENADGQVTNGIIMLISPKAEARHMARICRRKTSWLARQYLTARQAQVYLWVGCSDGRVPANELL